jgi:hypothetical protein
MKRALRTPKQILAEIDAIRDRVINDPTIKANDARWRRAILECHTLYQSLPNLHEEYHDDADHHRYARR